MARKKVSNVDQKTSRQELLRQLLGKLRPDHRQVIELTYGLTDEGCIELRVIAKRLKTTKEMVRQKKLRAQEALLGHAYFEGDAVVKAIKMIFGMES